MRQYVTHSGQQTCDGKAVARRPHLRAGGFTLIELLVVISIIALLIGILLPVLGSTRASARTLQCLSNQKNWGLALTMFTEDHKGWFPPRVGNVNTVENNPKLWYNALMEYVGEPAYADVDSGAQTLSKNSIWYCPEAGPPDGSWVTNPFNYAVNKELTGWPGKGPIGTKANITTLDIIGASNVVFLSEPEVSNGTQTVVGIGIAGNPTGTPIDITDKESSGGPNNFADGQIGDPGVGQGDYRHPSGTVNNVFADGHASNLPVLEAGFGPDPFTPLGLDLNRRDYVGRELPPGIWRNQKGDVVWGSFATFRNSPFD